MRVLFNHGLTPEELYTNTPKKITDKNLTWFNKRYGASNTYNDALSNPFKYCFGLIINRILDEKVRFKIPATTEAYIDFEIVSGDKFIKHRQNGRFSEIDFIESDFTGYALTYYFKAKAYQKSVPIYLAGELKQRFLNNINTGTKYYTIKDVTLEDFLDEVHAKFNDLTRNELKKLLFHGFRRMNASIKYGCSISISTNRYIKCMVHIGGLSMTPEKQIKEYSYRRDKKLRKIEAWSRNEFDGYYYIGLNPTMMQQWLEDNKGSRTVVKFNNIIPRKIQKELYYKAKHLHIFRYKRKTFKGYSFWADKLEVRKLEYLGEAFEHKFTPINKTWQELRKEYEENRS
jgi:hypothetical protein